MSAGCQIDWEAVACATGYMIDEIPDDLVDILERLQEIIRDANGLSFVNRQEFGLRSTQVLGLVVLLWKAGLLKGD